MYSNYEREICQAIDVIAKQTIDTAAYDKTVEATILFCEDAAAGKYQVQYQDSVFTAYSSKGQSYEKGDLVYVLIPSNNGNKEKVILWTKGKESSSTESNSWYDYGSGVGRFINPEKNSELFNDYTTRDTSPPSQKIDEEGVLYPEIVPYTSKYIDPSIQFCHIEGQDHNVLGPLTHCHIGGYKNTVMGTNKFHSGFSSYVFSSRSFLKSFSHSLFFGTNLTIGHLQDYSGIFDSAVQGSLIGGYHHNIETGDCSLIMGKNHEGKEILHSLIGGENCHFLLASKNNLKERIEDSLIFGNAIGCNGSSIRNLIIGYGSSIGSNYFERDDGTKINEGEVQDSICFGLGNKLIAGPSVSCLTQNSLLGGYSNIINNGRHLLVSGNGNSAEKGTTSCILSGYQNKIVNEYNSFVSGARNHLEGTSDNPEGRNIISGHDNSIYNARDSLILAQSITEAKNLDGCCFFTHSGSFEGLTRCLIGGTYNSYSSSGYKTSPGSYVKGCTDTLVWGQGHILEGLKCGTVLGYNHEVSGYLSPILIAGQKVDLSSFNKPLLFALGNGHIGPDGVTRGEESNDYKSTAFAVDWEGNVYCKSINGQIVSGGGSGSEEEERETIYLTNIDFDGEQMILTNNLSEQQTCSIKETIDENSQKNVMTITNLSTQQVLTISWPIEETSG